MKDEASFPPRASASALIGTIAEEEAYVTNVHTTRCIAARALDAKGCLRREDV